MLRTIGTMGGRFSSQLYFCHGFLGWRRYLMGWHVPATVVEWPFVLQRVGLSVRQSSTVF